jgi:hypothetical protein
VHSACRADGGEAGQIGEIVDVAGGFSRTGSAGRFGVCSEDARVKRLCEHCGEQHLLRYLAEFDFRYNNRTALGVDDAVRADNALKGIEGKRLTYRRTVQA